MPRIWYEPDGRAVEVAPGTTILQASQQGGLPHTQVCGGNARCSTCRVWIVDGLEHCAPRNEQEGQLAAQLGFGPSLRLACQTAVTGDVTVRRLVLDDMDVQLAHQEGTGDAAGGVGEERAVAILFADIRKFTAFAESALPYDVIHLLNRYFSRVTAVIQQHHGHVDNFMGDGVMALFIQKDPATASLNAVQAGLAILEAVADIQAHFASQCEFQFRVGVGVHYGEVVLGAVGAGRRRRLTAIGDAVNLASRIESANKEAGTSFLISEAVYTEVRDRVRIGRHFELSIRGKTGQHALFEVLGLRSGEPTSLARVQVPQSVG